MPLNPQPLPPGNRQGQFKGERRNAEPLNSGMASGKRQHKRRNAEPLNPQPLPPGIVRVDAELNPQPLPPGDQLLSAHWTNERRNAEPLNSGNGLR